MESDKACINFEKIENIKVNCVVGFGLTCRVAQSLKRNNLRRFSSPFDWMLDYTLDDVIVLLENKGATFFKDCYEDKNYACEDKTGIVDRKTGMVSMHDFPLNIPIEMAPAFFQEKYKYKFQNLDYILNHIESICIVTNRNIELKEIKSFMAKFLHLYNFSKIYHINIYDCDKEEFIIERDKNVTYMMYYFNDEHKDGRDSAVNPLFWLGNTEYWDKILNKIIII